MRTMKEQKSEYNVFTSRVVHLSLEVQIIMECCYTSSLNFLNLPPNSLVPCCLCVTLKLYSRFCLSFFCIFKIIFFSLKVQRSIQLKAFFNTTDIHPHHTAAKPLILAERICINTCMPTYTHSRHEFRRILVTRGSMSERILRTSDEERN